MNKFFQILTILLLVSILTFAENKSEVLHSFLKNVIELKNDQLNGAEPLVELASILNEAATKTIALTKANMKDALQDAGKYEQAIIIIGKHTIVKIVDLNDCTSSGSWAAAMPKSVALIQKNGEFIESNAYLNMLIGLPDNQERTLYLLNK